MASGHHDRFVTLSCDRTHFELHGRPFFFCGANCYYLMVSMPLGSAAVPPTSCHFVPPRLPSREFLPCLSQLPQPPSYF